MNCELKFNSVFSRHNLRRMKDGAYFINLDDKQSKVINFISLFMSRNNTAVYFDYLELNILREKY